MSDLIYRSSVASEILNTALIIFRCCVVVFNMKFIMQILDIDYFLKDGRPVIRMFGKKPNGSTVCAMHEGIRPYFYCEYNEKAAEKLEELNLEFEVVDRKSAIGYTTEPQKFCKVYAVIPGEVPDIRMSLSPFTKCYEADILFAYRYMVDSGIGGMKWVSIDGDPIKTNLIKNGIETYLIRSAEPIENIENAPLRYMCLDIECLQLDTRRAPEAGKDPIIMIALEFSPDFKGKKSVVLVAKRAKNMPDYALGFEDEKEMLEYFKQVMEMYDPDVVTGYNIAGYDFPYIEERMRIHKIKTDLGRSDKNIMNKKFAGSNDTNINGRVLVDTYQIIKRDVYVRFVRYDLNTVAKNMLGEAKVDMKYTEIPQAWAKDTGRLAEYAKQDASLAMKLLLNKGILGKFIEIAKISGIILQDSFRGQSIRLETMLLREYSKRGMVIPMKPASFKKEDAEEKITGGAVLEPIKGLHIDSVIVLDFQSLYPSIIKTYNISTDSLIMGEVPDGAKYHTAPNGAKFLDRDYYDGVLPVIIENLLQARREAKKMMTIAKESEKAIYDARQYSLKILANSLYGYTGYLRARLFVADIANAITAYGRSKIDEAIKFAENDWNVKVIYSDTDSLFIKVDNDVLDEVLEFGKKISEDISKKTGLVLEFEKIYKSFLILTKKRYAGWKFQKKGDVWEDSIDMRGIETVRRDWCSMVTDIMNAILLIILKERDVKKAVELVKIKMNEIMNNKAPIETLVIVKGITKPPFAYDGMLPHIELAKKLSQRNPGAAPGIGDRIGFVIVRGRELLSKRAEDPEYIKEKGLQVDADYYINNQLLPPVERILQAAGVEKSELLGTGKQTNMLDAFKTLPNSCKECGQVFRRAPLTGICDCGGAVLVV